MSRLTRFGSVLAAILICLPLPCRASGGPEDFALVVNADSWASLAVANEYVRLRQIPPHNVVCLHLGDLGDFEIIDVNTFRQRILQPVLQILEGRRLGGQIDGVLYSCDIPYAVNVGGDIGQRKLPNIITPVASVNGLTYLYQLVLAKDIRYLTLNVNFYVRPVLYPSSSEKPWTEPERGQLAEMARLAAAKDWHKAEQAARAMLTYRPDSPLLHYNLACCLAEQNQPDPAMKHLALAVRNGWVDRMAAENDKNLQSLRGRADFKQLMGTIGWASQKELHVQPTCGFRGAHVWGPDGRTAALGTGFKYLLSDMLALTSGRGNSVSEALACLRAGAAADATHPRGTVYYMTNGDIRSKTRQWGFVSAVQRLRELGVGAEIAEGGLPGKKGDVAGLMAGSADFNWASSGSTIGGGAICEHLTSCGGEMHQRAGQTPLTEFLRHGAALASGTVTEPYAIQAKFPTPFIQCHYASGATGIEAFYQSVTCPYQLLIVGDPLCRPWARIPQVYVRGLPAGGKLKGKITLTPSATVEGLNPAVARALAAAQASAGPAMAPAPATAPASSPAGGPATSPAARKPASAPAPGPAKAPASGPATAPATQEAPNGIARFELIVDGRRRDICPHNGQFVLDTAEFPDGWHELRVVAVTADPIESQGFAAFDVEVDNHGRHLDVKGPAAQGVDWDTPITLRASLAGAAWINFLHNSEVVATINGATGQVSLDPRRLGLGPVTIQPVGLVEEGTEQAALIQGRPVRLTVTPGKALEGQRWPQPPAFTPGLEVSFANSSTPPLVVKDLLGPKPFGESGLRKGQPFRLHGFFDVPKDDVYQFQVFFQGKGTARVDQAELVDFLPTGTASTGGSGVPGEVSPASAPSGRPASAPASGPAPAAAAAPANDKTGWRFLPVHLAKGTHLFVFEGQADRDNPRLDIRFGGPGARTLNEHSFKHVTP